MKYLLLGLQSSVDQWTYLQSQEGWRASIQQFPEFQSCNWNFPEISQVGVKTGPTSAELPTPKVPKVMAAINKDLLLEVFPRGLEVLSIPGGGPEVTADTLAPDPEALELGSSVTVTEVLFWLLLKCKWWWRSRLIPGWPSMIQRPIIIPRSPNPNHHTTNHQSWHVLHTILSCHEVSSFSPVFVSPKFDVSFSVQVSVHGSISPRSLFYCIHTISKHTHEKCDQASNRWSKLHLCLFLCVKFFLFLFPLFPLKSFPFPFPLLLPPFPFMKFQWPNPFPLPLLFPLKYPLPFSAPTSMGASPESEEVKMCLLLKYCTRVFLICSYVLIVAAFNRRCCWSAPEVLFIKVATSTLSGIGVPVCCSYLAFTVSQALKVLLKGLCVELPFKYLSQKWHMSSGIWKWKTLAQSTPSFKAISCCILANQKSSRSCTQVG